MEMSPLNEIQNDSYVYKKNETTIIYLYGNICYVLSNIYYEIESKSKQYALNIHTIHVNLFIY